jgi:outer membrane immunogenic protein
MQNKLSTITLAVLATTLLLGSTSVLAANYKGDYKGEAMPAPAPCPQPLTLHDGFYLGGQVGYDSYRTRITNGIDGTSFNPVMNATGFAGGLFGGYGMYWNNYYYLGAEVFVNGSAASQNQTFTVTPLPGLIAGDISDSNKFSVGASWGISLLPGLKVNDSTLAYIRLGWETARLTGRTTVADTFIGDFNASASNTRWQNGFQYGLGLETAVYPNVSVRSEYSHVGYGSFTDPAGTSYSVSDNQWLVGVIYHFM